MNFPPEVSTKDESAQALALPRVRDAGNLLSSLRASMAHHEVVEGKQLSPLIAYLGAWQSLRLSRTHADLLKDP